MKNINQPPSPKNGIRNPEAVSGPRKKEKHKTQLPNFTW